MEGIHKVYFYRDTKGREPVAEYIKKLASENSKDSRIKLKKIRESIKILSQLGTRAGERFVKHIDGDIWELRPTRDRILFVAWNNGSFVLLHQFMKQTEKTPPREIEIAKSRLKDMKERGVDYE